MQLPCGRGILPGILLSVNFAPVAHLHHEHAQSTVLNVTNHPAIAYPVTPESTKRAGQCLARGTRVFQSGDALVHEIDDASRHLPVELAELSLGRVGVINRPGQGLSLRQQPNAPVLVPCGHVPTRPRQGSSPPSPQCPAR